MQCKTKSEDALLAFSKALEIVVNSLHGELFDRSAEPLMAMLYTPNQDLSTYLIELNKSIEASQLPIRKRPKDHHVKIGKLMEQIACVCFKSLNGISNIESFQSAGPQIDLLVSGDNLSWLTLAKLLYMDENRRDILVEAKSTKKKIDDRQFARLCSLLDHNYFRTVGLGVFFTIKGATGFPSSRNRQRKIGDARLRQALFMAASKKPIVVFDINDISMLIKPGSLIKLLIGKIRDVEKLCGLKDSAEILDPVKCDLPKHLVNLL